MGRRKNLYAVNCNPPWDCFNCPATDQCNRPFSRQEMSYIRWQNENELKNHPHDIFIRIRRDALQVDVDSYGPVADSRRNRRKRRAGDTKPKRKAVAKITVNVEVEEC